MSTNIDNAYRLQPGVDVFTLRREVMGKLSSLLLEEHARELLARAVGLYNEQWAIGKEHKDFEQVLRAALLTERKDPEEPLTDATISVFQNPVRGEYYMKVYGALVQHHEEILALDAVAEDFYYSDSTDAPDGFTRARWQDRGLAWDEALDGGHGFLSTLGVQINLFSAFSARMDFDRLRELNIQLPSIERQANTLGLHLATVEAINAAGEAGNTVQAAWSRYLAWVNGDLDKAPYMAEAHAMLDVRPEPVLP